MAITVEGIKNILEGSIEDCQEALKEILTPGTPEYFRKEGKMEAFQDLLEIIKRQEASQNS